ncbi:hypothetical protein [Roseofilum sp. Guam]|uniref:hypothetical protein n=1 Tax=Roseofilum sp. Guam TaxID=2821502 RepID=UPI001B233293|nr:hypothetical protein [Roseofilum sp. Guam]MBP0031239.1 hypothetical protein [Roseofilum sp. Guam]
MDTHNQNSPNTTNKIAKLGAKISTTFKLVTNDPITSILCVFQGISWSTTVQGAHIIFPKTAPITLVGTSLSFKLIPLVLGSAVQLALILLLIARAKSQSTVRRWSMILVLTLVSIYTSFFCFYDGLLGGELTDNSPKKIEAHESLKDQVYTPLKAKYDQLQEDLATEKKRLDDEVKGLRSGTAGIGPEAKKLNEEKERIENELNEIKVIIEDKNVQTAFTLSPEDIEEKTAKDLHALDLSTWSSIPADYKSDASKPQFSDYENPEALLLPLKRLNDGDQNAIAALAIATFVDGSSLVLGSIGDSFSLSKVFTIIVSGLIMNLKRLGATIRRTINQESVPFETEVSQLSNSTQIIKLNSDIKGSDFLSELLNQIEKIDDKTYIIHANKLFNIDRNDDSDTNKKPLFYKLLLTKMECSPFNWLEDYQEKEAANFMGLGNLLGSNKMQNPSNSPSANPSQQNPPKPKKLRIKKECKDAFLNWLTSEIENQINQEQVESKTVAEISLYANPTLRSLPSSEET